MKYIAFFCGLLFLFPSLANARMINLEQVNTTADTAYYPDVAGNVHGQAVIAWKGAASDGQGGFWLNNEHVAYSYRTPAGYQNPVILTETTGEVYNVHPAISKRGTSGIVYNTFSNNRNSIYYAASSPASTTFNTPKLVTTNGEGALPDIDIGNRGGGISYDTSNGNWNSSRYITFQRIHANGGLGGKKVLSNKRGEALDSEIAVSDNGTIVVAWADRNYRRSVWNIKAAYKAPGRAWRIFHLSTRNSGEPSVSINSRGLAVVAWYEAHNTRRQRSQIVRIAYINRASHKRNIRKQAFLRNNRRAFSPKVVMNNNTIYLTWQSQPTPRSANRIFVESAITYNRGRKWLRVAPISSGFIAWQARPAITTRGKVAASWYGRTKNNFQFSAFFNQGFSELRKHYRIPLQYSTKWPNIAAIGPNTFLIVMTNFKNSYDGDVYRATIQL